MMPFLGREIREKEGRKRSMKKALNRNHEGLQIPGHGYEGRCEQNVFNFHIFE